MTPLLTPASQLKELERLLVERGLVRSGATGVFVNVSDELDLTDANFINLQRFA